MPTRQYYLGASYRIELMEELYARYGKGTQVGLRRRLRFWRKKYSWLLVVGGARLIKRTIDILLAGPCLIVLSPLFAIVALLIKLDGGPALYWQERVGKWGQEFPFPKFRSMVVNADQFKTELLKQSDHALHAEDNRERITFKMKKDPRITWIGRIIRRFSIDELPQLWCVVKGDMTLVGPRPPVPREVAQYSLSDRRRLDITPGLTCIWQVSGRADISFPQQVELDVRYIESQNLWLDCKILLQTIPAVLTGRGAY